MLDQRRVALQPDEKREQLFTERYEDLLVWAMRLTKGQRDVAEDLVHNAFVQFMLGRTRLEEIENIDGYLRRMLRYMHISRVNRSAQHQQSAALSVADYDSGRLGWTAIEPARRVQAFQELHQICAYACARKESSRAGSVLILRFFHEYFPTEIAAILNSSRHCVDQWQRLARREVKLLMDDPQRLRFVNSNAATGRRTGSGLRSERDLMSDLREIIFKSRQGHCLSRQELEEAYSGEETEALTTTKLAHVVSCRTCLDTVNGLLALPLLSERFQAGPRDPQEPPANTGGGGTSGDGPALTRKLADRLREIHEHKPQELRISVNGSPVSSLKISAVLSELDLNLTAGEPIEFVEISSEQGAQLLFFSIDPGVAQTEQWAWIELSEGRSLEACLENETDSILHVVYKDPTPVETLITGETPNALSSPLVVVPSVDSPKQPNVGTHDASFIRAWVVRLFKTLRTTTWRRLIAREPSPDSTTADLAIQRARENEGAPLFKLLGQTESQKRSSRQLVLLILLLSSAFVGGLFLFKATRTPLMTAGVLLEKARRAESDGATTTAVRHRIINLEERHSAEGAVVARHRIEIWVNQANGASAQRLYDESNRLIAATWQKPDGTRTVYHHGSKPLAAARLESPDHLFLNFDDIWQVEPTSGTFTDLIANAAAASVEERATTYVITFENARTIGASRLLKATLTLSKSDLHAIEQTLLVQRGAELREYRFAEASLERPENVAPSVFEVGTELSEGKVTPVKPEDWAIREVSKSPVPSSPEASTPPVASAELEVDVAYLLNQAKADRNEQVTLTRSAGGSLRVEGIVETEERKEHFVRGLAPVLKNPAVTIDIRTVAEAAAQRGPTTSTPITVLEAEQPRNNLAAEEDLRNFFEKQGHSGSTDQAIRSYASRVVNTSYEALFHAVELRRLANRFARVDMQVIAPDARSKWLAMLREHANAFERKTELLRQEIRPVFFPEAGMALPEEAPISNDTELAQAIDRINKAAFSQNDAICEALTISRHSSTTAIRSKQFWDSLSTAEKLATVIRNYGR